MDKIACIDLEGVLMPELWPFLAQQTGNDAFLETTRETPDYEWLMRKRIDALRKQGLRLSDVQAIFSSLSPLEGAEAFLDTLRARDYEIQIVSDCFVELATPILDQLGSPPAQCHRLEVDAAGFVTRCAFAPRRGKEDVVRKYLNEGATVLAVGDAFNDLAMLSLATHGFLVRPSELTRLAAPHLRTVERLDEITEALCGEELMHFCGPPHAVRNVAVAGSGLHVG